MLAKYANKIIEFSCKYFRKVYNESWLTTRLNFFHVKCHIQSNQIHFLSWKGFFISFAASKQKHFLPLLMFLHQSFFVLNLTWLFAVDVDVKTVSMNKYGIGVPSSSLGFSVQLNLIFIANIKFQSRLVRGLNFHGMLCSKFFSNLPRHHYRLFHLLKNSLLAFFLRPNPSLTCFAFRVRLHNPLRHLTPWA